MKITIPALITSAALALIAAAAGQDQLEDDLARAATSEFKAVRDGSRSERQ
jgi:hypothetical protein